MKAITVFCGSKTGNNPNHEKTAYQLGKTLAQKGITLIYGGAKVGLMGKVADGALENNGKVIGIIPHFLAAKEIIHENLSELILVESMHERKLQMNALCDATIALPGGFGTLEELFETLTWAQLGLHQKPMGLLNIDGFYDHLLQLIETMVANEFLSKLHQSILLKADNILGLLDQMSNYKAPPVPEWIKKEHL